jgi:hypothetical protein
MRVSVGKIELILTQEDPNPKAGLPFLFYKIEGDDELTNLFDFLKSGDAKDVAEIHVQVSDVHKALDNIKKKLSL